MQREYVWRSTRVRDLLDSLYRGYPSGVILTWQTNSDVPYNEFAVRTTSEAVGRPMLLLDGQQRLTSLSAVLRGELVNVRGRKKPIDILFNLDHPDQIGEVTEVVEDDDADEEADGPDSDEIDLQALMGLRTFIVSSKRLAALPNWVSVTDVMRTASDSTFLKKAGVTGFDHPDYEKYTARLNRLRGIKDYVYRMDVLEDSLTYSEVTEIFVRVNSLGAKLRSSDLALAQITARWPGSLAQFRDFQKSYAKTGYSLDLGTQLRMLTALLTDQSRFATVGSFDRQALQDGWERAKRALTHAINFMSANVGAKSTALLSSPYALIALGYWADQRGFKPTIQEADEMRQWLLRANAKGRWSRGSSETLLDQDLAVMRDGGGPAQLTERLLTQVGRLDITPEDLQGRTSRSALFKTMFLAFSQDNARDWQTTLAISVTHAGKQDSLQFHHIFPRAYLQQHRPDLKQGQVNDIANLAFIGGRTNKGISAAPPSVYLAKLAQTHQDLLTSQQVPLDPNLYEADRYLDFLAARRDLLATRLNRFLAEPSTPPT